VGEGGVDAFADGSPAAEETCAAFLFGRVRPIRVALAELVERVAPEFPAPFWIFSRCGWIQRAEVADLFVLLERAQNLFAERRDHQRICVDLDDEIAVLIAVETTQRVHH